MKVFYRFMKSVQVQEALYVCLAVESGNDTFGFTIFDV